MLRCRDRDCTSADTSVLGPPGRAQQAPTLALGPDGLPLVAVHDLTDASVTLIACRDPACARRDKARIGTYTHIPGPIDLTVGRDGLPRILWVGRTAGRTRNEAHLTEMMWMSARRGLTQHLTDFGSSTDLSAWAEALMCTHRCGVATS